MSETASAALCLVQRLRETPLSLFVTSYHQLCHALAIINGKRFGREINQYDTYFASIVGIYGTWRIEYGYTMLQCQPATRTHLSFHTTRKGDAQARRHKFALHRLQHYRGVEVGTQVQTSRLFGRIFRQWMMRCIYYLDFHRL